MIIHENLPDYLAEDEPELRAWLGSTREVHGHWRHYEESLRSPRNVIPLAPVFTVFGDSFATALFKYIGRAECYAHLSCLPNELAVEQLMSVPLLRPNEAEKAERDAAHRRLKEANDCLYELTKAAVDIRASLIRGSRHLKWMEMMLNGESLPMADPDRPEFARLRDRLEKGCLDQPPIVEACNMLKKIESNVYTLQQMALTTPTTLSYGHHQEMVKKCSGFVQGNLFRNVTYNLADLRLSLNGVETRYENMAKAIRQHVINPPKAAEQPGKLITNAERFRNRRERPAEEVIDATIADGSNNVVSLAARRAAAVDGTAKRR